jgi:hypothetical protein
MTKKTGRPLKFATAADLEAAGLTYLKKCEDAGRPFTITGLALALGTTRQTLLEYEGEVAGREKADPAFADAVKKLKTYIENYAEQALFINKNAAGPIFALKNFGWRDRHELTDPDGNPISPAMNINITNASADELLRLLTAKSADHARRRKRPGQTGRRS